MDSYIEKNYVHKNIYWDLYNKTKDDCKYYKDIIQTMKNEQKNLPEPEPYKLPHTFKKYPSITPNTGLRLRYDVMQCIDASNNGDIQLFDINRDISKRLDIYNERCCHIKSNGKQCRQMGKLKQSGGPIINGKCKYHR